MGYDPNACLANLTSKGLGPACQNLINPFHCDDVTNLDPALHQTCATAGIYYFPVQCMVCHNTQTGEYKYFPTAQFFAECGKLASSNPAWVAGLCYCCCSCFANDTLIAVPSGVAPIYTIPVGSKVLVSSVTNDKGGVSLNWSEAEVKFSQGTGSGGHQPVMVYIVFGADSEQELICNMDQPFLLADGKFTTAGKLRPGQQLVNREGQPQEIKMVSIGAYEGGVHHIATDLPWKKSPDGHLLLAGGVVAGDYTMQMFYLSLPDSMKEADYNQLPLAGTDEYDAAHAQSVQRSEALFEFVRQGSESPQITQRQFSSGRFKTYRARGTEVPFGAQSLVTPAQAADIVQYGSQAPISNPIGQALFNSIKTQLAGFYPDILFYYDALDVMPNLYAFEAYGQKIVQVSGGLSRMKGFNYEGLFMAMAHGVSCFYGGDPKNMFGYSAVGQADAYAFGVISRLAWIGNPLLSYVIEAMNQWQALFALVTPQNAGGNPKDPLNDPSLACRIQTIQSAAAGGGLPECAGGVPLPKISLEKAESPSGNNVTLTFSVALDASTAVELSNYTLNPTAKVLSAKGDSITGFIVHLEVEMDAAQPYEITVSNLTSILGTGLDPDHTTAKFNAATA